VIGIRVESSTMSEAARVLIVDDSRIFRGAIEEVVRGQGDLAVAGSVFSGAKALEFIRQHPPDVITLDVEMPGMNGLETLEAIQEFNRGRTPATQIGVLMVSAFTKRGAEVTVQALQAGAFDVVAKPSGGSSEACLAALREDLLPKIRAFLARRRQIAARTINWKVSSQPARPKPELSPVTRSTRSAGVVLIGASTGGPQALSKLLPELASRINSPILVVQHMPPGFTHSLAVDLSRRCPWPVCEAEDNQVIAPGTIYIAPGGKHLLLRSGLAGRRMVGLNEQPPESGCRPSASVLFRSAAAILGSEAVAVVLTGMGNDGTAGLGPLKRAGGTVIVQDEESSVVWGMPGSVVAANLADIVAPLENIASEVEAAVARRGRS
jgi:two-component system chemotaxis response regulator CheB